MIKNRAESGKEELGCTQSGAGVGAPSAPSSCFCWSRGALSVGPMGPGLCLDTHKCFSALETGPRPTAQASLTSALDQHFGLESSLL